MTFSKPAATTEPKNESKVWFSPVFESRFQSRFCGLTIQRKSASVWAWHRQIRNSIHVRRNEPKLNPNERQPNRCIDGGIGSWNRIQRNLNSSINFIATRWFLKLHLPSECFNRIPKHNFQLLKVRCEAWNYFDLALGRNQETNLVPN